MKRRFVEGDLPTEEPIQALARAIALLNEPSEVQAFLQDLCTPAELEALADRWRVVPLLLEDVAYREIHARTSVSVTTIGRVARCLTNDQGGYHIAISNLQRRKLWPTSTGKNP